MKIFNKSINMKKIIFVSLLAAVFSTNVFSSVACSILKSGYCPDYRENQTECLAHYQTSGRCSYTPESSCEENGGSWLYNKCTCPNIICTYDSLTNGCFGNGSQCTN